MRGIAVFRWFALLLITLVLPHAAQAQTFVRPPFLQLGSPHSATVCWRLNQSTSLTLAYGTTTARADGSKTQAAAAVDGCLTADNLQPGTRYYYSLSAGATQLAAGAEYYFVTHPAAGKAGKYTFWLIGDAGTGNADQAAVRDAFVKANGNAHSDGIVMLGDNAYQTGTDAEFTNKLFKVYPAMMGNSFTWPTIGNHENMSGGSAYLSAFTLPTEGQSGGVASKNELYYSFDYGNVHFICLDSEKSGRKSADPMYKWLEQDLQAARQDWIVVYFHHPPYTWGTHNSDTEQRHIDMRTVYVPLMEKYGVDLVFGGHSHDYERSYLLDSAVGNSADNKAKAAKVILDSRSGDPSGGGPYRKASARAGRQGTVYTVAGSSGMVGSSVGKHAVMHVIYERLGSVILTIEDNVAEGRMVEKGGAILDRFQLVQAKDPSVARAGSRPDRDGLRPGRDDRKPGQAGNVGGFLRRGRHLYFPHGGDMSFRLYGKDGRTLLETVPVGTLHLDVAEFPRGEYYFRYGSSLGAVNLP